MLPAARADGCSLQVTPGTRLSAIISTSQTWVGAFTQPVLQLWNPRSISLTLMQHFLPLITLKARHITEAKLKVQQLISIRNCEWLWWTFF